MATDPTDFDASEQAADRAAMRRDFHGARTILRAIVDRDPKRVDAWLKLAAMCRAAGDGPAALRAVSGALAADPLHFVALLTRGRLLEAEGERTEAARAYLRALAQLPAGEAPPPAFAAAIAHARAHADAYLDATEANWDAVIDAAGDLSDAERARLHRFKTNTSRRTEVYHSEPTHYAYPGLAEREFHDRADFPWLAALEAASGDILAECQALIAGASARAEPYIQYDADVPLRQWAALNRSMDWTAFHLLKGGERVADNADRCPRTMAVLAEADQPRIAGRGPNAMFSLLKPHTRIPPHTGVANTRLVCHLPLIVPDGCWFRVGATTRAWVPGEAFVFDDTIEHEAANDSGEPRIVFIIDTWHPGLSPAERAAVMRVMEAEEEQHGAPL